MSGEDGTLQPVENYGQGDTPISNTLQYKVQKLLYYHLQDEVNADNVADAATEIIELLAQPHPSNTDDCYCVCHSSVASNVFCEHCKGDNEVGRHHGFANPSNTEQLDKILDTYRRRVVASWSGLDNANHAKDDATQDLFEWRATHTAEAVRAATEPYQRRLAQWLQPELMQMFVLEDMDRPMLLATCARYADWLLELDRLAQLKDPKGGE